MRKRSRGSFGILVAAFVLGVSAPRAGAWLIEIPGQGDDDGKAFTVAFDSAGDIIAGGAIPGAVGAAKITKAGDLVWKAKGFDGWGGATAILPYDNVALAGAGDGGLGSSDVAWARISGVDGEVLSSYQLGDVGNTWAQTVITDAVGYMIIGASDGPATGFGANGLFTVTKVGLWTRSISTSAYGAWPGAGVATRLAVDANGDVIGVGRSSGVVLNQFNQPVNTDDHLIVAKLAGATGAILWQFVADVRSSAGDVATDAAGDVVVSGALDRDFAVIKLDGDDGSELWRVVIDGGGVKDFAGAVLVDGNGDVVAGGVVDLGPNDPLFGLGGTGLFTVVKLAGSDGSEVWQTRLANDVANVEGPITGPGVRGQANDLASDPAGNIVAVGALNATWLSAGTPQARDFVVVKLSASDGGLDWLQNIGAGEAFAVAVDDDGVMAVAGWTRHVKDSGGSTDDFAVLGLSDCLAGRSVKLSEDADPTRRTLKLKVSDRLAHTSAPGTAGDPTLHGGRLILTDGGSMDETSVNLPAHNWTVLRSGYLYRDVAPAEGPCSFVKIRKGKVIAKCRGTQLDLVARHAPLESMAVRFELGLGGAPLCMEFGGDVQSNTTDFAAREAPPPSGCLGR